jgi:hypothetical protein
MLTSRIADAVPTAQAIGMLSKPSKDTNAVLHLTC